jgi:hypothetical protein
MSDTLAQQQKEFLACLQFQLPTEQAAFRHQVQSNGKIDIKTRLGIYQNAYQVRLQETIDTDHNILGQYLGGELYELMMNEYISRYPSQQFSLRHFSEQLPTFLASHSPFNEHPQIFELARFEQRLLNTFDAPDSERANFSLLKELPPQDWPELKIRFHPSVQLLENHWNSVEIYQALKDNQTPPEAVNNKNSWLLWRNTERLTEFRPIDDSTVSILLSLQKGLSFSEVCQGLLDFLPEQEVSNTALQVLTYWLNSGLVARLVSDS